MSFVRTKTIKGHQYFYLVESVAEGKKVKQVILQYYGRTPPKDYIVPTKAATTPVSTIPAPTREDVVPTDEVSTTALGNKWHDPFGIRLREGSYSKVKVTAAKRGLTVSEYIRSIVEREFP
jgi:hypothetical protein